MRAELPAGEPIPRIIDAAFHYRGYVTLLLTDGRSVTGYVCNRNDGVADPFLQYLDEAGDGPFTLPYARVLSVRFTGKDPAAGNSYEDYQRRKGDPSTKTGRQT